MSPPVESGRFWSDGKRKGNGQEKAGGSCPPALFDARKHLRRFDPVFHAVAFSFDDDRFAVMKKPVENGGGHSGIVIEDRGPLFERFISGQTDGSTFIASADDLEKQIGASFVDRHIPELIED